jgi:uncharacterized membrane protein YphA (DoxX/SURF4 family)
MLANLLKPKVDLAALLLRWGLASLFVVHGFWKVMQEEQLLAQLSMSTEKAVGWAELVCGLALALGLLTRLAALGVIALQVGAIALVTGGRALRGPEINPTGADYMKVGPEYNLLIIVACLAVVLLGSGAVSLDHLIGRLFRRQGAQARVEAPAVAGAR